MQPLVCLPPDGRELVVVPEVRHLHHRPSIDDPDESASVFRRFDGYVTRKEESDFRRGRERHVGQCRAAGAEDRIRSEFDAQLFAELLVNVDPRQDAESFVPERLRDTDNRFVVRAVQLYVVDRKSVV